MASLSAHPAGEFEAGAWVFSKDHGELVRVLEAQALWDHTTYLVWVPTCAL